MTEGYSGRPLYQKLGIKEGHHCLIINDPPNYIELLERIPANSEFTDDSTKGPFDFIHVFVRSMDELGRSWQVCKPVLKRDGMLWVSWPKQSSAIETDLNGNHVREYGLAGGLVDTKVCAVDADWSGLKFMYRKADR